MIQTKPELSALEAKEIAQQWAFAPIFFQAIMCMRRMGIFTALIKAKKGISIPALAEATKVSEYGILCLLEAGITAGIVTEEEGDYKITKVGYFLAKDPLTDANIDFVNDICYEGMFHLQESIEQSKPVGLKKLGDWPTLYEGLSKLKEPIKTSWFKFDHYYSDGSFNDALDFLTSKGHSHIMDIGGNTGKFALAYTKRQDSHQVTIVDLPGQIEMAKKNIGQYEVADRVNYYPTDILSKDGETPAQVDAVWMSQFLDCFSNDEIVFILEKIKRNVPKGTPVYIMETFWDNQKYDSAAHCLTGTSLYFTAIANGNSKMYGSKDFIETVNRAGFKIDEEFLLTENSYHTILKCSESF
jgi:ubiquinone/menaquinone biosynthesis C-methylase UbiE